MQIDWTSSTQSSIYEDALMIRTVVFIHEQKVPLELEVDELEEKCHHLVIYDNNHPLATARLYVMDNEAKVQRVAVLKEARGKHIGFQIMQAVEEKAKALHLNKLTLGAQNHAIPFYEKLGYAVCSKEYDEANIKHHDMMKILE